MDEEENPTNVRLEIGAASGVDDTSRPLPQNDALNETVNIAKGAVSVSGLE